MEAQAVDLVLVGVGDEGDDEVEALLRADRGEAVEVGDVDDADAADFQVAAGQGGGGGDQFTAGKLDADHVVGDQRAAFFDQADGGLALAGAAFSHDQDADPAQVDHAAVERDVRRELVFQSEGRRVEEFHGHQRGAEDRDAVLRGDLHVLFGKHRAAGNDQPRNVAFAHPAEAFAAHLRGELL